MDRRQRKTREAIFRAFTQLLSQKDYDHITVGDIIALADIGRATFYSHFETKDYLLKDFCEELFCHIFDADHKEHCDHRHIFNCDSNDSPFLHLFRHLLNNDNNILLLLSSRNNELFLKYFRSNLELLIERQWSLFQIQKSKEVPETLWKNHIVSTYVETLKWWIDNGIKESAEQITEYFFRMV